LYCYKNAVLSADGQSIELIRPALGEEPIKTSIILYAKDTAKNCGDKKVIDISIPATTDTENVFDILVIINASVSDNSAYDYTITITKNGVFIKEEVITIPARERTVKKTIKNIPANASGIEYDVKVVSKSNDFTVTVPEGGVTNINGKTGEDFAFNNTAQKIIDEKVKTNISFEANTSENKIFDLISLAKSAGAGSDVDSSDIITVEYDVNVNSNQTATSYIDLTSQSTLDSSCNASENAPRFILNRIYNNWGQFDLIDNSVNYSSGGGSSSNVENHKWLNCVGKFKNGDTTHYNVKNILNLPLRNCQKITFKFWV